MSSIINYVLVPAVFLLLAGLFFFLGYLASRKIAQSKLRDTDSVVKKMLEEAEKESSNLR